MYREIIAVCSEIHTKHTNTLCGQNVGLLNVKPAVHIVRRADNAHHFHRLILLCPKLKLYQCSEILTAVNVNMTVFMGCDTVTLGLFVATIQDTPFIQIWVA